MLELRLAKVADFFQIKKLFLLGAKENFILNRSKKEIIFLIKHKCFVIACADNEIVGMASLDFYSKRFSELRSVYVKKDFRKQGIGKLIVNEIIFLAKKKKVKELMLVTTKETQPAFQKMGFIENTHGIKVALFKNL
jgi:amino-acid N-acetyltransferase